VNEHQLQKWLTQIWVREGWSLAGEQLFLAAWEVSTDYSINDAKIRFGVPAVDFVFLDREGQLVCVELKMRVGTPRQAWSVLCQVTHRAQNLAVSFTPERLAAAYTACWSGRHGRVAHNPAAAELRQAHARFFHGNRRPIVGRPVRRVVAACSFGRNWELLHERFVTESTEAITADLARYRQRRKGTDELQRWRELPKPLPGLLAPTVQWTAITTR
jgi:hypothetical protein